MRLVRAMSQADRDRVWVCVGAGLATAGGGACLWGAGPRLAFPEPEEGPRPGPPDRFDFCGPADRWGVRPREERPWDWLPEGLRPGGRFPLRLLLLSRLSEFKIFPLLQ